MSGIVRPQKSGSGGGSFLGFKELGIVSFEDKSNNFDWADVYLKVEMKVEGSQYTRNLFVSGSHEKDDSGNIIDSSLLKRIYYLFDAIGFQGGLNLKGQFVDEKENIIPDIAGYLNDNFAPNPIEDPSMSLVGYLYKEAPRKNGDGKVYSRIHNFLQPNTAKGLEVLKDRIQFLKSKNFIKEADETTINGVLPKNVEIEGAITEQL
tara:strand:+ start:4657 stop:5274 length:618 start_codon:yes stop_codon:yes gene_type:complete